MWSTSCETGRIARREHFRTISILCYPQPGVLASEVIDPIIPKLQEFQKKSAARISDADWWREGQAIGRLRKSQNRPADFFGWGFTWPCWFNSITPSNLFWYSLLLLMA
jgi:hypothetical protein